MAGRGRIRRPQVTKGRVAAVSVSAAALLAGGLAVAEAAIPGTNGVITVCYDKSGTLRVIDTDKTSWLRGYT